MGEGFCTIFLLSLVAVGTQPFGVHAETAWLNEGDERTITCPRPLVQRLNIISARYYHLTETCESPGALQTLQARCGGQPSCYVRAGDDVFGDSCLGQSRLEFSYECLNLPEYHGCFGDNTFSRALSGPVWRPVRLTIQACLKYCRTEGTGYKYAGVESADECFCGNNENFYRHGREFESNCNDRCAGDSDQFCGGHWLIEIYESSMGNYGADQTLDGSRHYVYSPDFPGLYPSSKICQWTISGGEDKVIKLQFDLFNLTSGDVIKVRNGTEESQDLGSALTGTSYVSFSIFTHAKIKHLSRQTKMKMYNTLILSVLLYGAETWTLTKTLTQKLNAFDSQCLRKIEGIRWHDHISNTELRHRTKQPPVSRRIVKRQLNFLGHASRAEPTQEVIKLVTAVPAPTWKRPRGRPRNRWEDLPFNLLEDLGVTRDTWRAHAANRSHWKELSTAAMLLP